MSKPSNLEDTLSPKVASSCFDFLLIELVPLAYRINTDLAIRDEAIMTEESRQHLFPNYKTSANTSGIGGVRKQTRLADRSVGVSNTAGNSTDPGAGTGMGSNASDAIEVSSNTATDSNSTLHETLPGQGASKPPSSVAALTSGGTSGPAGNAAGGGAGATSAGKPHSTTATNNMTTTDTHGYVATGIRSGIGLGAALGLDTDQDLEDASAREAAQFRLDALGYRVGQGLAERYSTELSARPTTQLECIKFVCKDLWTRVFKKQVDNLKTNHRGTFVLTDNRFGPIARVSMDRKLGAKGIDPALARVQTLLWFPSGIIRGALSALGMTVEVHADSVELPVAIFQIRSLGAKT